MFPVCHSLTSVQGATGTGRRQVLVEVVVLEKTIRIGTEKWNEK